MITAQILLHQKVNAPLYIANVTLKVASKEYVKIVLNYPKI